MLGVFANRTARRDFVMNELATRATPGSDVYIAVAFFTESEVVKLLLEKGCRVWMVVRLGFPTSPHALKAVMSHPNIALRFYSSRAFHPKLYVFGDKAALVGSANLTGQALLSNQEVVVSIDADEDEERFTELAAIFDDYWHGAEVLTAKHLEAYARLYAAYSRHENEAERLAREAADAFGNTSPANINRGKQPQKSKQSVFVTSFRKTYQETVAAFNIARRVYEATGYRKAPESAIPLRLEIDSFVSYVRQEHARGDSWDEGPLRNPAEQEPFIRRLVDLWSETPWPYFERTVVRDTYPKLIEVFKDADAVMRSSDKDLFEALATLHSFSERLRYKAGGLAGWAEMFPTLNDPARTRESLAYLVFGPGDVVERMANMIYNPRWKLREFGPANVQELVGWLNREELPVLNGRTTKVLRYFGSKVHQLSEKRR